jgi:3-deoxy-7-phosphoheptulonate synthase
VGYQYQQWADVNGSYELVRSNEPFDNDYAALLAPVVRDISDRVLVVMRFCPDKPRTGVGWSGFAHDPDLNGSYDFAGGWSKTRELAVQIIEQFGIPLGMEFLDPETCQRIDDLFSYNWVGARTVASPRLRQITSALSTAVGFKNSTDGSIDAAIEGINTARHPSAFTACNDDGLSSEFRTLGNPWGHLILRGDDKGPNYSKESVTSAVHRLSTRSLCTRIVVDASHGNSRKDHKKQIDVVKDVVQRRIQGEVSLAGVMVESYLREGKQTLPVDLSCMQKEISVTDACLGFDDTEFLLRDIEKSLAPLFPPPVV